MATVYTPNAAHTPATITVPDDGDNLVAGSATVPLEDLADLVANARLNAAKTNIDNHFGASQSITGALHVSGGGDVGGQLALNGGRAQVMPNPFTATRVMIDLFGNAGNGKPFLRTYLNSNSGLEFVINGFWNEGTFSFDRDATGSPTIKYVLDAFGMKVFYYSGAAASVVDPTDWTKTLSLQWPFSSGGVHPVGAVLGLVTDNDVAFSTAPLSTFFNARFPPAFASALAAAVVPTLHIVGVSDFGAGWSADAGSRPVAYWKDVLGVVHLEGSFGGGGTSGTAGFNLPVGFRPSAQVTFSGPQLATFGTSQNLHVAPNGDVTPTKGGGGAMYGVNLEGITFRADA